MSTYISNTFNTTNTNVKFRLVVDVLSQDIINNKSQIRRRLQAWRTNTGFTTYGTGTSYMRTDYGAVTTQGITSSQTITYNSYTVLYDDTVWISHNGDGSRVVYIGGYFVIDSVVSSSMSDFAVTLPSIPRESTATATNADIESATSININRYLSTYTTTLRYEFPSGEVGALTGTIVTKTPNTSVGWTVPSSFYAKIPNNVSSICKIYCDTYNGDTLIGTTSTTFTATVGVANKPDVSATIYDNNATTRALTGENINLTNLITNGDFSNGTTGWSGDGGNLSTSSNVLTFTGTSVLASAGINQTVNVLANNKYYVSYEVNPSIIGNYIAITVGDVTSVPSAYTVGVYNKRTAIMTPTINSTIFRIFNEVITVGDTFMYKSISVLNLTASFGAGNEPTKAEMDNLINNIGWFNGTLAINKEELYTGYINKFVKFISSAVFSITSTPKNSATIVSRSIVCGAKSSTSASGTLTEVESAIFVVTTTDSRGLSNSITYTKTLIDYVKLTLNPTIRRTTPTGDTFSYEINGNYFNATFGIESNTLKVEYRVSEDGGTTYTTWTEITGITPSGNAYSKTGTTVGGFDYTKQAIFQIRTLDKVYTTSTPILRELIVARGVPVFNWGDDFFRHNTPLYLNSMNIIDLFMPIGKIEITVDNVNPSTRFPGTTWVAWGTGRVPVGVDTSQSEFNTVEKTGGAKTHTLTAAEMPSHAHDVWSASSIGGVNYYKAYTAGGTTDNYSQSPIGRTDIQGGGQAHNNLPPYITCYYWKRTV